MIGSPELEVDGVTAGGERVPVLRDGDWQLVADATRFVRSASRARCGIRNWIGSDPDRG